MRFPFHLLLCTVFLLNAAVFADLALYLAVGGLASVELPCSLTTLVLRTRLAPIPRLPILVVWSFSRSLSLSLKLVCSRSATLNLEIARLFARSLHYCIRRLSCGLLEVGASVCSGPCCESSSGPSVLPFALVESLHFSARP